MVRHRTLLALREPGRRAQFPGGQLERLDELIVSLVTARAPGLLKLYGARQDTPGMLLIAAGDHPGRLRSEAAWAHLCACAPIPASSGKVARHKATGTQHCIGQLAQLIGAGGQASVQVQPEPRQHSQGLDISSTILQAVHHGLCW